MSSYLECHTDIRSVVYESFQFLCHANTRICAGFVVCNYVSSANCSVKHRVRPLDKTTITSSLKKHINTHQNKDAVLQKYGKFDDDKKKVRDAAAVSVVMG